MLRARLPRGARRPTNPPASQSSHLPDVPSLAARSSESEPGAIYWVLGKAGGMVLEFLSPLQGQGLHSPDILSGFGALLELCADLTHISKMKGLS